jgi:hypothetical protein
MSRRRVLGCVHQPQVPGDPVDDRLLGKERRDLHLISASGADQLRRLDEARVNGWPLF